MTTTVIKEGGPVMFKRGELVESSSGVIVLVSFGNAENAENFTGCLIHGGPSTAGVHGQWNVNDFKRFSGRIILDQ